MTEKEGVFMAYQNPKPILHDEQQNNQIPQKTLVAEYTQIKDIYFAFIDVLGFKQTFDENRENPDTEFASAFNKAFQYFTRLMNSAYYAESLSNQWNSGQTSDSLYFYTKRIDFLAAFIKIYSHFCLYAMSQNVFLRGGIAKGSIFVSKPHQFYGDSVIKAYLLESSIAKVPQIVVDQCTYDDLIKEESALDLLIAQEPPKRNYIKPFAYVAESELQILINTSATEFYSIGEEEWLYIQKNIQKNMERFEFDDKNYQKYAFLQSEYKKAKRIGNIK
jgi:hypothetical protein